MKLDEANWALSLVPLSPVLPEAFGGTPPALAVYRSPSSSEPSSAVFGCLRCDVEKRTVSFRTNNPYSYGGPS
jgi:hypothetical protein